MAYQSRHIEENNIRLDNAADGFESHSSSLSSSPPPQDFEIESNFDYQERQSSFDAHSRANILYNILGNQRDDSESSRTSSISLKRNRNDYGAASYATTNIAVIKCPVCEKLLRDFYCAKCIQAGNFVNTNAKLPERFAEKRLKFLEIQEELSQLSAKYEEMNKDLMYAETLQIQLRNLNKQTETLKLLHTEQELKLKKAKNILENENILLEQGKKACKSKEGKIEYINKIITNRKAFIDKRHDAQENYSDEVGQLVRHRAYQLTNDIFTIEEINLNEHNNSMMNMETSPLLTFSNSSNHQIEQQIAYSIVEPWLPSDGDYSAYSLWVNDHHDHIQSSINAIGQRSPAYRIASALAYTTQLVRNLALFMDINLPARVDLHTFNRELLDEAHFSYNVAKLNTNIIHLCVLQGIDLSLLNPKKTLKNLLMIFDPNLSEFGRKPILDLNDSATIKISEKLESDLSLVQDNIYDLNTFYADDDTSDSEWELSDSINPIEMQMINEQSIQQNSYIRMPLRFLSSIWGSNS